MQPYDRKNIQDCLKPPDARVTKYCNEEMQRSHTKRTLRRETHPHTGRKKLTRSNREKKRPQEQMQ